MMDRAAILTAFLQDTGWAEAARTVVAGDASARRYLRLTRASGENAILMDAPSERGENVRPFISIANHLRTIGLSAPEIYHADPDTGFLLIEDFGTDRFAERMAADPSEQMPLYRAATDVLLHLRTAPRPDLAICDAAWLIDMLDPLFEWYAPDAQNTDFVDAFAPLAEDVAKAPMVLMLRDYHVENLLLLPDRAGIQRVGLLDFQDAMLAHPAYDLVSILQDARRDVPAAIQREMIQYYIDQSGTDAQAFRRAYATLGLQRNLRILGIFARLCLRDGKAQYVDMIPRVWGYVQTNLTHPDLAHLAPLLHNALPAPSPDFLEQMKRRCPPTPILS